MCRCKNGGKGNNSYSHLSLPYYDQHPQCAFTTCSAWSTRGSARQLQYTHITLYSCECFPFSPLFSYLRLSLLPFPPSLSLSSARVQSTIATSGPTANSPKTAAPKTAGLDHTTLPTTFLHVCTWPWTGGHKKTTLFWCTMLSASVFSSMKYSPPIVRALIHEALLWLLCWRLQ